MTRRFQHESTSGEDRVLVVTAVLAVVAVVDVGVLRTVAALAAAVSVGTAVAAVTLLAIDSGAVDVAIVLPASSVSGMSLNSDSP